MIQSRGLTRKEFANLIGVKYYTIQNLFQYNVCSDDTLAKLNAYFGCDMSFIVKYDRDRHRTKKK